MNPGDAQTADAILNHTPRPVWIVTAAAEGRRSGLVATWVQPASLDPAHPLVMVGLAPNHFTAELVRASGALGLHLLRPDQAQVALRLGLSSGRDGDKLAGLELHTVQSGAPILADCLAWLDCKVVTCYDAGARLYFWAEALAASPQPTAAALTDAQLIAAATPEQRSTLQAQRQADAAALRPLGEHWLESVRR